MGNAEFVRGIALENSVSCGISPTCEATMCCGTGCARFGRATPHMVLANWKVFQAPACCTWDTAPPAATSTGSSEMAASWWWRRTRGLLHVRKRGLLASDRSGGGQRRLGYRDCAAWHVRKRGLEACRRNSWSAWPDFACTLSRPESESCVDGQGLPCMEAMAQNTTCWANPSLRRVRLRPIAGWQVVPPVVWSAEACARRREWSRRRTGWPHQRGEEPWCQTA